MTIREFAAKLDGRQYGDEMRNEEEKLAKELDFLVVFGASDDLAELRGAIDDECGCFNGGKTQARKQALSANQGGMVPKRQRLRMGIRD